MKKIALLGMICLFAFSNASFSEENKNINLVTVGQKAPDFTLKNLHGEAYTLSHYLGEVVVLGFFDSRNGICSILLPDLESIKSDEFVILGIDLNPDPVELKTYELIKEELGITFPFLLEGRSIVEQYGFNQESGVVFIDRQGIVRTIAEIPAINRNVLIELRNLLAI